MLENIYKKIEQDKNFAYTTLSLVAVFFIFLNIAYWQSTFIGFVFSIIYMFINTIWLARIFASIFKLSRGWSYVFGLFGVLMLGSLLLSIPLTLFRYTSGIFIFLLAGSTVFLRIVQNFAFLKDLVIPDQDEELDIIPHQTYALPKYLTIAFIPLLILALWFLFSARTGEFILSPWDVVPRLYVYVYLIISVITSLLLFSQRNARVLLLVIILHSFVLHAYLPLVYQTGFGGDKWRHVASERLILTGAVYQPSLLGDVEYAQIGPWRLPSVLVSGNKTSYGQQWSLTIGLSQMLAIDVFWIDFWLGFFLWSIFFPLLSYKLAGLIRPGRNFGLLFAWLPSLFYPLQVFGAITLPVSVGHLLFILALFTWLYFYKNKTKSSFIFALGLSVFMFFSYVLYFILVWQVAWLIMLLWLYQNKKIPKKIWLGAMVILTLFLIALLPALEMIQGFGFWNRNVISFGMGFSQLADAFGYLSGLVAFWPQTGHIDQGNFLFNQTRSDHAPVSLLSFRWWPFFFTVLIWLVIVFGIRCIRYLKQRAIPKFFVLLLTVVMGNYIISWYFLDGNHILARRLDQVIVLFMSVFLALGIMYFIEKKNYLPWTNKILLIAVVLGFIASSTYVSGPLLQVVTADEHKAAKYVWAEIDKSDDYYCVVANTWPLLAVEGESARAIIGGGFPVGFEYSQVERVKIFEKMSQYPDTALLDWAKRVTFDDTCFYMTEDKWINDRVYKNTVNIIGEPEQIIGDVYIWRY